VVDPRVEVFRHLLSWVAEEMGAVLVRSARSVNIKERRDCSCAIFDADGRMLAQAEHIPVHLGSMPLSVAAALAAVRDWRPGDAVILNDPYHGGTHLPDVTLVAPVFVGERPAFFTAARAHFADIGGAAPGSMPVATDLYQEGLVIPPMRLGPEVLRLIAANVRHPRGAEADLAAMEACLRRGERRLRELCARYGAETVASMGRELIAYGERLMRAAIAALPAGTYRFADALDDDGIGVGRIPIRCAVTLGPDGATVDFTGSSAQVAGGVNCVAAVTLSAVLYGFRCLLPSEAPTNAGCLAPIRVVAPEGSLLNARPPAAVAAGNVETSQRIVDVVFGALARAAPERIPAASGGTMNNVAFGTPVWGFYETIGCGMGARPDRPGVSAVQTHMTNTRNTPVEAMERALPVRVTATTVRRGSGGAGRRRGGDGLIREFVFLDDVTVCVISDRRLTRPYGLRGGAPGKPGVNRVNGKPVPGKFTTALRPGERLRVETPGGGGYGKARRSR
jgi:N-methylhydantoinase B